MVQSPMSRVRQPCALVGATLVALAVLLLVRPPAAFCDDNFVKHGDFAAGNGSMPDDWRSDRWDTSSGATDFMWKPPAAGEPGQAGIKNIKPNDARFVQDVHVREQSWYRISGKIRTENVGLASIGAYLSLMEGFQNTQVTLRQAEQVK